MKTGFACGVFDLFHIGHVLMLEECRQHCDYLVVAINKAENLPADKNKPVYSIEERVKIMESSKYADEVLVYASEEELEQLLRTKKIDIRFLGDDYRNKPITAAGLDMEIHYIDRGHGYSTSGVLKRVLDRYCK